MTTILNYINGTLQPPVAALYLDNYEPATGQAWSQLPDSDVEDVELAYSAAKNAFALWSKTPLEERMLILLKIAEGIEARMDEFVAAESKDNGTSSSTRTLRTGVG